MHNCALVVMGFDADFARAIFMDKLVLCQCGESGKYSPHHSPFKLVIGDVANGERANPPFASSLWGSQKRQSIVFIVEKFLFLWS